MNSPNQLALAPKVAKEQAAARQYLLFALNNESFAIDILHIREIIEYGQLTQVPMMPDTVRGVINLRGAVVPVIDLSARFGRPATQAGRRTCIVIAEVAQDGLTQTLGIVVDAVNAVTEIAPEDIEAAPSFGARIRTDFIAGMARQDGRFVIVLDVGRVLSMDELSDLAGMAESAPAGHALLASKPQTTGATPCSTT